MNYRVGVLALSFLLYGLAMTLPCLFFNIVGKPGVSGPNLPTGALNAYGYPDNIYEMKGIELTIAGLFGLVFLQLPAVGWLANPLYWASCVFLARQQYRLCALVGLVAVSVGLAGSLSAFWWRLPSGSNPFTEMALQKLLPGFWVWLAAPGLLILASLLRLWQAR
ncbi:MAG TPA: hypothetical protein V6D03_07435 [Candidatus Caenarcaniphilales bacterium]